MNNSFFLNTYISKISFIIIILILFGCRINDTKHIGATNNMKSTALGGGKMYKQKIIKSGDVIITNKASLFANLKRAKTGQTLYIQDDIRLDLSGHKLIKIPAGVTMASGRGKNKSNGALIYSNTPDTYPLFITGGAGVRISGIRIQGPDSLRRTKELKKLDKIGKFYSKPNSSGIRIIHDNCEIDNCEIFSWTHSGVHIKKNAKNAYIHHNYIHHNQRHRLGYGISIYEGFAKIRYNVFDWNRHHIAGSGLPNCGYEASYNLVLQNASSHAFDMHGGGDRKDGTNIAGDKLSIHNNTFYLKDQKSIVIRGIPAQSAEIYNNEFIIENQETAFKQIYAKGNIKFYNNVYGVTKEKMSKDITRLNIYK